MTRCYEFYCMYGALPDKCDLSPTGQCYADLYMKLLGKIGIQFNKSSEDKNLFTMVNTPERVLRPLFDERNLIVKGKAENEIISDLQERSHDGRGHKRITTNFVTGLLDRIRREEILKNSNGITSEATFRLLCGDFRKKGIEVFDESVSLLLTDPPYGKEYLNLWEPLGALSQRVLKPGGFLIAYAGQDNLPQKLSGLSQYLSYYWTDALLFTQQNVEHHVHMYNWWKPVLVFYKPPLQVEGYIGDLIKDTSPEKNLHPWQQTEKAVSKLIEYFCPPGGLVFDPMAGSGTTLAASLKLGHSCIGIDVDPENIEIMKGRLGNGAGQK